MKAGTLAVLFLISAAELVHAVPADVTYAEGSVSVRRASSGRTVVPEIGDVLNTGDTVKTAADGYLELDQAGVALKINPKTVFTLMERARGAEKTGVLSVTLGSVKLRYNKLTGKEPMIQTATCAAGVRGTELTVFAGEDGSSLIAVDTGIVDVEAEGKTVQLTQGLGVEVKPGQPPGDPFVVHYDQIDYRTWNDQKVQAMMEDPAGSMDSLIELLKAYAAEASDYDAQHQDLNARLTAERQKAVDIASQKGQEAARLYGLENINPLATKVSYLFLNIRFTSLAALSMRRYVTGRLYVLMKATYITRPEDPAYQAFLERYREFLAFFEQSIAPHLVGADI